MKVKFKSDAMVDGKLAFEKDSVHDLNEQSAQRWIKRQMAELHGPSVLEKVADTIQEKTVQGLHGASDALDKAADTVADLGKTKESDLKPAEDAASKPADLVAKPGSEGENDKNKNKQNPRKGL